MGKRMNLYIRDTDAEQDSFRVHYKGRWWEVHKGVMMTGDYDGNVSVIDASGKVAYRANLNDLRAARGHGAEDGRGIL